MARAVRIEAPPHPAQRTFGGVVAEREKVEVDARAC